MVKLYWIAFVRPRKSYRIGILFTHTRDFHDRSETASRRSLKWRVTYGIGVYTHYGTTFRVGLFLAAFVCHILMYYLAILSIEMK